MSEAARACRGNSAGGRRRSWNTFDIVGKPLREKVLIQQYDADTQEHLWAVALISDEKAEKWCISNKPTCKHCAPEDCAECQALAARTPDEYFYERACAAEGEGWEA